MEWVQIVHPDLPGQVGTVTKEAFEQVHRARGWRLLTPRQTTEETTESTTKARRSQARTKRE